MLHRRVVRAGGRRHSRPIPRRPRDVPRGPDHGAAGRRRPRWRPAGRPIRGVATKRSRSRYSTPSQVLTPDGGPDGRRSPATARAGGHRPSAPARAAATDAGASAGHGPRSATAQPRPRRIRRRAGRLAIAPGEPQLVVPRPARRLDVGSGREFAHPGQGQPDKERRPVAPVRRRVRAVRERRLDPLTGRDCVRIAG